MQGAEKRREKAYDQYAATRSAEGNTADDALPVNQDLPLNIDIRYPLWY